MEDRLLVEPDGVATRPVFELAGVAVVVVFSQRVHELADPQGRFAVEKRFGGAAAATVGVVGHRRTLLRHPLFKKPAVKREGDAVGVDIRSPNRSAGFEQLTVGLGQIGRIEAHLFHQVLVGVKDRARAVERNRVHRAVDRVVVDDRLDVVR